VRYLLGGFRCSQCGTVGADLDEMGFRGEGYVRSMKRAFSRGPGHLAHAASWDGGYGPHWPEG
jgi:hypothetical protein